MSEINQPTFEQIEAYLEGELSGKELAAFEQRLQSDAAFSAEVNLHRELMQALSEKEVMELENTLLSVRQERTATLALKGRVVPMFRKYRALAAGLVLLIAALIVIRLFLPSEKDLFASYYEPYPIYLTTRSATSTLEEQLGLGIQAYEAADYSAALPRFEAVLVADPENLPVRFYQGISYLQVDRPAEAIEAFREVVDEGDPLFVPPAEWYLALAHLKAGNEAQAKIILQGIVDRNGDFAKKARALFKDL